MGIPFTKMHGLGNDYLFVDAVTDPGLAKHHDLPALARAMSDRHRGIGSDGLIVICRPDPESGLDPNRSVRMIMFNADGSEGEMCGNGIRCVAKYAVDHGLVPCDERPLRVQTAAGVLSLEYALDEDRRVDTVTVDMGPPIFELERIPVVAERLDSDRLRESDPGAIHRLRLESPTEDRVYDVTFVSMGNPHAVVFVDDVAALDLDRVGPSFECHPAFPRRINTHFVEVVDRGEVIMRTWERGSGATQACGTGASAVCVAGVLRGRTSRAITARLPGGDLRLHWNETDGHVRMTGPAVEVFHGEWPE